MNLFSKNFKNDTRLQIAYVTNDMDEAIAVFRKKYGVLDFLVLESDYEVVTPRGPEQCIVKFAWAWVGDTQVELVQTNGGECRIYDEPLPKDRFAVVHHHYGHLVYGMEDWGHFRGEVDASEFTIAIEGALESCHWVYLDARPLLGHYIEYSFMGPDLIKLQSQVPQF